MEEDLQDAMNAGSFQGRQQIAGRVADRALKLLGVLKGMPEIDDLEANPFAPVKFRAVVGQSLRSIYTTLK